MEENKQPYFSIVMPMYNAENYIGKMLQDICAQTFTDWELLVVDDCSEDKGPQLVQKAADADPRIRMIRMERNDGVSAARNRGIRCARGRYLWLADADDSVDRTLLESVKESLDRNPARLVIFGLIEEYYGTENEYQYSHAISHEEKFFTSREELRPEMIKLEQETLYGYPWNKVYDLGYLKKLGLEFEDYNSAKFIEDITFNIAYCMDIDSLNILSCCPYHYAKRVQGNLTNEFVPDYFKFHRKRIRLLTGQYESWGLLDRDVKAILGSLYGRYILSALQRNCDRRSDMGHGARRRWCRALFDDRLFCELIPYAQAKDSRMLNLVLGILRRKNVLLCLAAGRAVYLIRNRLPVLYSKAKSGR